MVRTQTERLKRLRKGESNKSDVGGVLQTNNIHICTCKPGDVPRTFRALKASPATARSRYSPNCGLNFRKRR